MAGRAFRNDTSSEKDRDSAYFFGFAIVGALVGLLSFKWTSAQGQKLISGSHGLVGPLFLYALTMAAILFFVVRRSEKYVNSEIREYIGHIFLGWTIGFGLATLIFFTIS